MIMKGNLEQFEEEWAEEAGYAWYRSKEPVPIYHSFVGGGYLSNKKWPLNEECISHIVTLGNVKLCNNKQCMPQCTSLSLVAQWLEDLPRLQKVLGSIRNNGGIE